MVMKKATPVPIEFQAFAWNVDDGSPQDCSKMEFTVRIFGKDKEGKSVGVHVNGYHPTFCLKIDRSVAKRAKYDSLCKLLSNQLVDWKNDDGEWEKVADYSDHLIVPDEPIIMRKDCWGFSFNQQVPFFQFSFRSMKAYYKAISFFKACQKNNMDVTSMKIFYDQVAACIDNEGNPIRCQQEDIIAKTANDTDIPEKAIKWIKKLGDAGLSFEFARGKLFEVIDPILRFAHVRNLRMAGWIRIQNYHHKKVKQTTCQIEVQTSYTHLDPITEEEMEKRKDITSINAHIKEMAFDIEAYSHNDLFPDPSDPRNHAYQISITMKNYADKGYHRRLLHMRTPNSLSQVTDGGICHDMEDIPTCLRSMKPVGQCEMKECRKTGKHDVFMVKTIVENYDSEKEVLLRFSEIVVREDPDLIYGYNSDVFDWNYLMVRAQVTGCMRKFCKLSRLNNYSCKVESKAFNSSAYGDNKYLRVDIPGRLNIDLMIWIQRNMPPDRYPSYSLDTVAEKEIGEQKRDVDAKDIFQAFRSGDPDMITKIGDYCCQDTMLVQKLVNKLDVVTQMMEMSNITATPPMYLLQKGQQIKCFSQLSKEAREKGYLIPLAEEREDGKFKGAVVLDPLVGKYDTPVAVLDFASLYPSIQVAYQVCYTTIVMDENLKKKLMQMKENGEPLVVKGVKFDIIEWEEDEYVYRNKDLPCNTCRDEAKRKMSCETCNGLGMKTLHFANEEDAKKMMPKKEIMASIERNDDGEIVTWRIEKKKHAYAFAQKQPSLIPDLQVKLKKSRKLVKGMMAPIEHAKDVDSQLRYRVLNGRQLAIKVSMNSLYGFTSAFMMNLQALSAVVTAKGRQMIEQTKEFLENRFESIAKKTLWTLEDEYTFYAPDGKEVVARVEDVSGTPTWIMEFRGKELARSRVGTIPTDDDGKSWIKKYPTAVAGGPWTDHDLDVRVVYGDTDSCFVNFPNSTVAETISLSHKAADLLTDQVFNRAPIEMEYEKTYHPVFIQKKKTYVGIKYEMDDVRWKIDYKGIAVKRRNYCELMKKVLWSVIYPSLGVEAFKNKDGKTELRKVTWDFNLRSKKALESLRVALTELSDGRVEIDDLVISASLKSTYKGPTCTTCDGKKIFTCKRCAGRGCDECRRKGRKDCSTCGGRGVIVNLPHIQLAKRMKERDEGSAPISGQRFGYIVVNDDSRPAELSARTEDPKYAKRNGLKPDYLFYLDQQIRKPVTKFMNLLDENRETEEIFADCQDVLFSKLRSTRMERERQVRQEFFDTSKKRPAPVAALKPPKRPTLSKDQKFKKSVKGMKPILSFFD